MTDHIQARPPAALSRRAALTTLCAGVLCVGAGRGVQANTVDFATWLKEVRAEALRLGYKPATLDAALKGVQPIARVLELDRKQPEFTLTFDQYVERVVNAQRIQTGQRRRDEHRQVLDEIGRRYRVPPQFIVALWGIETDFGRITGNFPVIAALATLAYDGRRAKFFRGELMQALKILDDGHIAAGEMRGSWAGAMGQSQFMPSSFNRFAVDYDGDGRRDIWHSQPDVFASIANYLSGSGWKIDQPWGVLVTVPASVDRKDADLSVQRSVAEWRAIGIQPADGRNLPAAAVAASVLAPGGPAGPAYLVTENFRTIMKWNRSIYFATATGLLADGIARG
ncbi:MAG: lytic murein transglycosylase [Alphaproteobacteria bacterium]|nr:lytic murein transglycosylase [Alphaproteobacteria bacterium]